MTMLASLKSLLFSTTPLGGATAAGVSAVADGATDFAALLSDVDGAPQAAAPVIALTVPTAAPADAMPLPAEEGAQSDATVVTADPAAAPALPETAEYLTRRTMPVQFAAEPALPVAKAEVPVADPILPDAAPVQDQAPSAPAKAAPAPIMLPEAAPVAQALPLPNPEPAAVPADVHALVPAPQRDPVSLSEPVPTADVAPLPPVDIEGAVAIALADSPIKGAAIKAAPTVAPKPLSAVTVAPEGENITDVDSEADTMKVDAPRDGDDQPVAAPISNSLPAALPPLPQAPIDAPASSAPSAPMREMPLSVSPSLSSSLPQTQAPSKPALGHQHGTAPAVGADGQDDLQPAALVAAPALAPELAAATTQAQPVPAAAADVPTAEHAPIQEAPQPAVAPLPVDPAPVEPSMPVVATAPVAGADMPADMVMPDAKPTEKLVQAVAASTTEESDGEITSTSPDLPVAHDVVKPAKAEALSLLQLARDHMNRRVAPVRDSSEAAAPAGDRKPDQATIAVDPLVATAPAASHRGAEMPMPQTAAPQAPSVTPAAMPTVDLSASLGQQMVDMGVSGQWIDGLARDIAGLSANGAQGRFQISSNQLGPIAVDIRQDGDGAAISLTVASEAAELALRQDSDRLKLDASLSAVRISEVKIERAPQVTESAKADGNSQSGTQSNGQQGHAPQHQGAGQMAGQSMGQSSSQGRWQGRENNGFGHKAGGDPAVLNHGDAGDSAGDVRRARYA